MHFLINEALVDINVGTAGLVALLGYLVVFFGLVLLMLVIIIVGKIMVKNREKKSAPVEQIPNRSEMVTFEAAPAPVAPGSAGELKLHDVDPKTAALLMAIVADKMNKPINELRFISIREVK